MNKRKVSNLWLKRNFNIITVGGVALQFLLKERNPMYYTAGTFGWNCDAYYMGNNTMLCMGYRPPNGIKPDYNIISKFENKAEKIYNNTNLTKENRINKLDNLIIQFLKQVEATA